LENNGSWFWADRIRWFLADRIKIFSAAVNFRGIKAGDRLNFFVAQQQPPNQFLSESLQRFGTKIQKILKIQLKQTLIRYGVF